MNTSRTLPESDLYDITTGVLLADVDFDGEEEVLICTYGQHLLIYKSTKERKTV